MKSLSAYAVKLTGAAAFAVLLTTSAFADSRHQDQTYRAADAWRQNDNNYRGGSRAYNDTYLRGTVIRVDYRSATVWLRDARNGRTVEVDMRAERGGRGLNLRDLRRGDRVEVSGDWTRGGLFMANRIQDIRNR
jgi:hypothetical protein